MHVDDRLATVLNARVYSTAASRIQYRQLLDLVGTSGTQARSALLDAAMVRLGELASLIPADERARAIAQSGVRLRNPALVALLASDAQPVALAAVQAAQLSDDEWLDLVPALPLAARGLLRLRRTPGSDLDRRLDALGIADRALPSGLSMAEIIASAPPVTAPPAPKSAIPEAEGISAIVRRIEAFRKSREAGATPLAANDSPRLPLGELDPGPRTVTAFAFSTDSTGRIGWADADCAAMTVGLLLPVSSPDDNDDDALASAFRRRQPIRAARLQLEGAPAIAGDWQVDAAPDFDGDGHFTGYIGRFRRPPPPALQPRNPEADRIRQVLHELRTPVNAIQGFAEVIQQQLFGQTPHEYRALAAGIASDAARMLAGFEELDRYARIDSGVLAPEEGSCDLAMVVAGIVHQLEGFTMARSSGFSLAAESGELLIRIDRTEAEHMMWRLLGTLAGAALPGEVLALDLRAQEGAILLTAQLPQGLAAQADLFEASPPQGGQAINAGVFGTGFTLRLAASEARAAGGELCREEGNLALRLPADPALTVNSCLHNPANAVASHSGTSRSG